MALVTLAAAKAQLNIGPTETKDDVELQTYIDAATAVVEEQLGQVVEQRTVVDQLDFAKATTSFLVNSVPVISLTSVTSLDGVTSWAAGMPTMHVDPSTGLVTVLSGPSITGTVLVSYEAGMAAVPANYRLAGLIIIQHLWETQRGTMGVQLGDAETYMAGRGFAVPRRAIELLGSQLPGVA
ncbi:phage head-tail connector protein [Streptomyces sp. NPDC050534]|uniref:phage head-tail connector protein n=1 Tax=Streptomyces sp. NPDC050534 TaxID=3365625 RepID=UPI0037A36F15